MSFFRKLIMGFAAFGAGLAGVAMLKDQAEIWPLPWPAAVACALYGVSMALFFVSLQVFVERFFLKDVQATARALVASAILLLGPIVAASVWPRIAASYKTVDVTAAVVQGSGRWDVLVSGFVNDPGTPSLGLQRLTIEEPGRAAYERHVALSPERTFEIVLGEPQAGKYSVAVHWRVERDSSRDERIKLPELVVDNGAMKEAAANAKHYDYQRLFMFPAVAGLAAVVLLGVHCYQRRGFGSKEHERSGS
jgi:hypothetical protein